MPSAILDSLNDVFGLNSKTPPAPAQTEKPPKTWQEASAKAIGMIPQVEESKAGLEQSRMAMDEETARQKAIASAGVEEKYRGKITEAEEKRKQFPYPEFHPTQENAMTLGAMMSIVSTLGLMLGSRGKLASLNAIKAQTGMLQGWREGNAERYKKEAEQYNAEMARMKAIRDDITRDLTEYMSLLPVDRESAQFKAEEIARKNGSQAVINKLIETGKAQSAMEMLQQTSQMLFQDQQLKMQNAMRYMPSGEPVQITLKDGNKVYGSYVKTGAGALAYMTADGKRISGDQISDVSPITGKGSKAGLGGTAAAMERTLAQDAYNAWYNLKTIKRLGEGKEELPGGSFVFANRFTGNLTGDIERYIANSVIDPDNQSIDALLTNLTFDIASGLSGGRGQLSDSKIREVASQMPLDSQPEETKKERWSAVVERIKGINKFLPEDKQVQIPQDVLTYFGQTSDQTSSSSATPSSNRRVIKFSELPTG